MLLEVPGLVGPNPELRCFRPQSPSHARARPARHHLPRASKAVNEQCLAQTMPTAGICVPLYVYTYRSSYDEVNK